MVRSGWVRAPSPLADLLGQARRVERPGDPARLLEVSAGFVRPPLRRGEPAEAEQAPGQQPRDAAGAGEPDGLVKALPGLPPGEAAGPDGERGVPEPLARRDPFLATGEREVELAEPYVGAGRLEVVVSAEMLPDALLEPADPRRWLTRAEHGYTERDIQRVQPAEIAGLDDLSARVPEELDCFLGPAQAGEGGPLRCAP